MNNYCAFSNNHQCLKWIDYQLTRHELEEADELAYLQKRVEYLGKLLKDNGIPVALSENMD